MSQATTWGLQTVGPASAAQVTERGNASLNALMTLHSGAARPAYLSAGLWLKTVSGTLLELYYFSGSSDILLANVNPTDGSIAWQGIGSELAGAQAIRVIYASSSNDLQPGTTEYYGPRSNGEVEKEHQFAFPFASTLKNLRVNASPAPGVGESLVVTLRKNGADTELSCVLTDSTTNLSNILTEVSILAGDVLSFEVQASAGANIMQVAISAELEMTA